MSDVTDELSFCVRRPWWWWLNPWLYAMRRDRAYEAAIESLIYYGAIDAERRARPLFTVRYAETKGGAE